MKLALLMGNRFNPWHLQGLARLHDRAQVTAFRAESQIQRHFEERDDGSVQFAQERIFFDTQAGPWWRRFRNLLGERYSHREPRILPFSDRLKGFDLIHTWELFPDWSGEAARARRQYGVPLVTTVWDLIPFNMESKPYLKANKQAVASATDRFIVYTERSRRTLHMEGIDDSRIALVPPGADTSAFCEGEADRKSHGLHEDAFVILFVGWFLPRKGIDFLLMAVRDAMDHGVKQPIQVVMIGAGAGRDRVEALIRRLRLQDQCVFTGAQPYNAMPGWFRCCDAFVLPSIATETWQEQFGMSLIEAMACGMPCIATRSGAIPEIAGDAALLVQPNDFGELSAAMIRLMHESALRAELGAAARHRVHTHYSLDIHTEALWSAYREALES